MKPVIALDAMGGDRAPAEIVAGGVRARGRARRRHSAGRPARRDRGASARRRRAAPASRCSPRPKSIAMDEEPAAAVRTKKDSSLVACARAVKEGRAAGDGRRRQHRRDDGRRAARHGPDQRRAPARDRRAAARVRVASARSCWSTGARRSTRNRSGSSSGRVLAREYARVRLGVDEPTVGLLSNGEEPGKGDALRKAAAPLLAEVKGWVGNVEGRDLLRPSADVILTDGFTGNVALKTRGRRDGRARGAGVRRARRARVRVRRPTR